MGYEAHLMLPTENSAYTSFVDTSIVPGSYESFCAAAYAVDTSLPIISFGQRDKWHPALPNKPAASVTPDIHSATYRASCEAAFTRGWVQQSPSRNAETVATCLSAFRWFYLAIGWFLATMLVAGVSGLVGRD